MSKWYKGMYGEHYYRASFAHMTDDRTNTETAFIEKALDLPQGSKILDLCCGPGRHTMALADKGYTMSGLDLSKQYLKRAAREARKRNLSIDFRHGDMRKIPFRGKFDAVINIFTSFGYFQDEEDNFKVIEGISRRLKPGGKFLVDVINRDYLIRNITDSHWFEREDVICLQEHFFDAETSRIEDRWVFMEKGSRKEFDVSIRVYALHEMIDMFERAGLKYESAWGGFDGQEFCFKSKRLIVLGSKQ